MKKIIQFLTIPFIISCTTSKVITTNLQDLTAFEPNAQIYALPKTTFIFEVTATRHSFQPGPYHQYAKRFLGIEGTRSISDVYWQLERVDIKSMNEPDMDHYYSVKFIGDVSIEKSLFELGNNGFIISHDMMPSYKHYNYDVIDEVEKIHFTDLTISPFINEQNRKKPKASSIQEYGLENIPSWQKHISGKTFEEKAFEAAKFIFKIRKRRFKLLAGQYEVFPEGVALETSMHELNELEEKYLSLFIGKTEIDTIRRIFTYAPVANEPIQRENLFRFSEATGFTSSENQGIPIILEVKDMETNKLLNGLQLPISKTENALFYRQPDKASVKLLYGSHELMLSVYPVYQFGALLPVYVNQ